MLATTSFFEKQNNKTEGEEGGFYWITSYEHDRGLMPQKMEEMVSATAFMSVTSSIPPLQPPVCTFPTALRTTFTPRGWRSEVSTADTVRSEPAAKVIYQ